MAQKLPVSINCDARIMKHVLKIYADTEVVSVLKANRYREEHSVCPAKSHMVSSPWLTVAFESEVINSLNAWSTATVQLRLLKSIFEQAFPFFSSYFKTIASADMDLNQLEAFLTAQTKKQGGITSDQAAVIAKFWKNHRIKIHESLINQSRWDNVLKNMNWRVDLKSQSRHIDQINTPVAIVEMELGKNGQESEFLCLEFDEAKVNQMLKKLSEIEESITLLTQTT
nr:PREDICTED: COMM domain-containing protein 1 [Pelecanus crispus]